jgi:hypothetical protein
VTGFQSSLSDLLGDVPPDSIVVVVVVVVLDGGEHYCKIPLQAKFKFIAQKGERRAWIGFSIIQYLE